MNTIGMLTPPNLSRLDAQAAVEVFRDLVWAQAWRLRYPFNKIHVSTRVAVPDGGVDARVDADQAVQADDPILGMPTSYQIKTGTTFSPWQPSSIKKELFGDKEPTKGSLGSAVRRCMENGDRYILVCFGLDLTDDQRNTAVEHVVNAFMGCGYTNPTVEVWGQAHLIGMLTFYPSICLRVAGQDHLEFYSHASWSQDAEMRMPLHLDDKQTQLIRTIQACLRGNQIRHVRVIGEPGVGKSRLVREATSEIDLAPLVVFVPDGESFQRSDLFRHLLREDNRYHAIVVIDECAPKDRASIWSAVKGRSDRIRLITLDHGPDDADDSQMQVFSVPALDSKQIKEIIQEYGLSEFEAGRWAEFCQGSPRVAHVIGMNLQNNQDDLFRPPATMQLWNRYVCGRDDEGSERVQQRQMVLRFLSVFERFGFESPVESEAMIIAELVHQANPGITWSAFQSIVKESKERRILQGRTTLYITPRLFHAYLFRDFWDNYGRGIDLGQFLLKMPPALLRWFTGMVKFAHTSEVAMAAVRQLLGPGGLFQDEGILETEAGSRLLMELSETDAGAVLGCLQRTVGRWDRERLVRFVNGRRHIIWALERIAAWDEQFDGATQLLLALGEAENENFMNNASGVFSALFNLVPGMAMTQAPASRRLAILKGALSSPVPERRKIGLRACGEALSVDGGARIIGAEFQGLRPPVKPYCPETYGELWRSYRDVWNLLIDTTREWNGEERRAANSVAIREARGVLPMRPASQSVMDGLEKIADDPVTDQRELIHAIASIIRYREAKLEPDIQKRIRQLDRRLQGLDFPGRLKRFISYRVHEDDVTREGVLTNRWADEIEHLAKRVASDSTLLFPELPWLVRDQTGNSLSFGAQVGKIDCEQSWLKSILDAQHAASDEGTSVFLAGYLSSCFHRDVSGWEETVLSFCGDPVLRRLLVELLYYSGVTECTLTRAVELAEAGAIPPESFRIWSFGRRLRQFSEALLRRLLILLINRNTFGSINSALQLCHGFYLDEGATVELPEDLCQRLLTHPILFCEREPSHCFGSHCWSEIAKRFIELFPRHSLDLFDCLLRCPNDLSSIISLRREYGPEVAAKIVAQDPEGAWHRIATLLGDELHSIQSVKIEHWLAGDYNFGEEKPGPIILFPTEILWAWVSIDQASRALWLAKMMPLSLDPGEGGGLTRDFLMRWGSDEEVASMLMFRFSHRGYCGPESGHYRRLRDRGRKWLQAETDPAVRCWIERYIAGFHDRIRQAEIEEERDE